MKSLSERALKQAMAMAWRPGMWVDPDTRIVAGIRRILDLAAQHKVFAVVDLADLCDVSCPRCGAELVFTPGDWDGLFKKAEELE